MAALPESSVVTLQLRSSLSGHPTSPSTKYRPEFSRRMSNFPIKGKNIFPSLTATTDNSRRCIFQRIKKPPDRNLHRAAMPIGARAP